MTFCNFHLHQYFIFSGNHVIYACMLFQNKCCTDNQCPYEPCHSAPFYVATVILNKLNDVMTDVPIACLKIYWRKL